jgi:hypothetical protein
MGPTQRPDQPGACFDCTPSTRTDTKGRPRECATAALALAQQGEVTDGRVATALETMAAVCLEAGESAHAAECCARAMLHGTQVEHA